MRILALLLLLALPAAAESRYYLKLTTTPADATVQIFHPSLPAGRVDGREAVVPSGNVRVRVAHPDYEPLEQELAIAGKPAGSVFDFHVRLRPQGLRGQLLDLWRHQRGWLLLWLGGLASFGALYHRRMSRARRKLAQEIQQVQAEREALADNLEAVDPNLIGRKIDDYRVLEEIGGGSFGQVFKVRHESYGEVAALKLLRFEVKDERLLARFRREAQIAMRLNHPGVVRLHAFGTFRERPYMVMELVEGEPLDFRLRRGPLRPAEAVTALGQLCRAVQAVHEAEVVHRDIKPANVMLADDGGVKLLDFGIAKAMDEIRLTCTGEIVGTPAYMAPEQLSGTAMPQTDVYALGMIFYEMLTGEPPFTGDPSTVLTLHCTCPVPSLPNPELDDLVQRMTAKDPLRRPASIEEVVQALEELGAPLA